LREDVEEATEHMGIKRFLIFINFLSISLRYLTEIFLGCQRHFALKPKDHFV